MRFHRLGAVMMSGLIALSLAACEARIATRGNLPDPKSVAGLKDGKVTKDEIADILGSPSSINTFGDDTWYYISEEVATLAFFEPEIKKRQVLVLRFDKKANLKSLEVLDLKAGRRLAHVERVTPTFGEELTVLGQIIGNFQRFVKKE